MTDVSAEFAAAYLPNYAGAIQSVRQTVDHNRLHQEIVYSNQTALAGENVLTVDVGVPESGKFLRPPSLWQVRKEMHASLSTVRMSMSPVIGDNVAGSYGYATASVGKGSCLYAWQFVKQLTPADAAAFVGLPRQHLSATLRLRYCHPSISADRIHVMMDGLRLKNMNTQTIAMLRFAAGTADVAQPQAVVTAEPVTVRRKVVRQAAVTNDDDDWRKPMRKAAEDSNPGVIDNAAVVPLPEGDAVQPVTMPVSDNSAKVPTERQIPDAAQIPIPD